MTLLATGHHAREVALGGIAKRKQIEGPIKIIKQDLVRG
jgi:hypothetical protein